MNKTKIEAVAGAAVTAVFGFLAWLVSLPPEQQTGVLGQIVSVFPAAWQPAIGFWTKTISSFSVIYMVYKASHTGASDVNRSNPPGTSPPSPPSPPTTAPPPTG
jgi:hypothetical protein